MPIILNGTELNDLVYNGVELEKVICNGVVVFEKVGDYLLYTAVDVNGNYDNSAEYNGVPVKYVVGRNITAYFKYVQVIPTPTKQEDYWGKYYLTADNEYSQISSYNITDLIENGKIIVGETPCYDKVETTMEDSQTSSSRMTALIRGYIGEVVIPKEYKGLPVKNTLDTDVFTPFDWEGVQQYPTDLYVYADFEEDVPTPSLYARNNAYINIPKIKSKSSGWVFQTYTNYDLLVEEEMVIPEITIGKDVKDIEGGISCAYNPISSDNGSCKIYIEEGNALTRLGKNSIRGNIINYLKLPSSLTEIEKAAFESGIFSGGLEIPSTITKIGPGNFTLSGSTIIFKHSNSDVIDITNAFGSSKTAITVTIYTDNQYIHDYNWAGANVTPTFYHLDGTPWEETV